MFLSLLDSDPNPLVRGMDPDPSITKQNSKKILDSYCFVTSMCRLRGGGGRDGRQVSTGGEDLATYVNLYQFG
jgi:hypothetical protein